ncbi:MAG: phosphoglycerate mutase family protein [Pyrinomonadaceae bacterium]
MIEESTAPRAGFRTALVFIMLFAVLGAVVLFAYFATFERPLTTIILIRHAEKNVEPGNADPNLSPAGQARAQELVRMFGDAGIGSIYGTQYRRTLQTVKPLADKLGISITQVDAKNTAEVIRQIRSQHNGEVVFVSGHNNTVPEIIAALGGPQLPNIPETEFDNLYVVTVYRVGGAKLLKLKYGSPMPASGQGMNQ